MVKVLIVDDQPDDVFLTRRALARCSPSPDIDEVADGQGAIDYLLAAQADGRLPDLVLLDLNLLGALDGFDVLDFIRSRPVIRRTLTVVLTSSSSAEDITRAYDHLATAYIVKPARMQGWVGAMQGLMTLVGECIQLPHQTG